MTIDQLLDTRNASTITLNQLNIEIKGIQFNNRLFRNDCECVCDCNCNSDDNYNSDSACYCS